MNFPHQPEQLTAAWLTDTLRQAGVLNGANVASYEVKPLSETAGLLGQNTIHPDAFRYRSGRSSGVAEHTGGPKSTRCGAESL